MAAARAQQRSGGVTAVHVWLIAFVALWLTSTVLLVWLYTDQAGYKQRADDAMATSSRTRTELDAARQSMGRVTELATGSADDDEATVASKVGDLHARIRQDNLVPDASAFDDPTGGLLVGMTALYEAYVGEHNARTKAEARADEMAGEVERLTAEKTEREQTFGQHVDELVAQVQSLETDHTNYRQQRDTEMDGVEGRIEALEQQGARDIQQQRTQSEGLEQERDEYKSRLDDLQAKLGELLITPSPLITARQGDGAVLTAKYGEDVVYINLGARHNLTVGMQFAVYAADQEIPADGRGKARIEVARVFENSAECVIRELLGRSPIVEGDVINNPIYEKDRSLTFVVAGRFDLDGDGADDSAGAEAIEALIRAWGGQVTDAVTARVDFVVVGSAPVPPSSVEAASPEGAARQEAVREAFEVYAQRVETAQALSVPILTEEVFLHFLGYAGRGEAVVVGR